MGRAALRARGARQGLGGAHFLSNCVKGIHTAVMGGSRSIMGDGCHLTAESGKQKQVVMGDVRRKGQNGEPQKPTQTQYRGKDKNLTSKWYTINLLKMSRRVGDTSLGLHWQRRPQYFGRFVYVHTQSAPLACLCGHTCMHMNTSGLSTKVNATIRAVIAKTSVHQTSAHSQHFPHVLCFDPR